MTIMNHLFKTGQKIKVNLDGKFFDGEVKETYEDYIIVDVPTVSEHCYFDTDMLDMVYPDYNFKIA